jgi:anti-anti-sigma factor
MRIRTRDDTVLVQVGPDEFGDAVLLEGAFERIIENLQQRPMVVDLSAVGRIPSLGIAVIMAVQSLAQLRRSRVVFAGLQPSVRKSLEVVGVLDLLSTYDLAEEALIDLRSGT